MFEFEAADGALLSDKKTWTASEALGGIMAVGKEHMAVLSEDGASICTAGLSSEDGHMQCVRLADMDAQLKGSKGMALEATGTGVAVLTSEHGKHICDTCSVTSLQQWQLRQAFGWQLQHAHSRHDL